MAELEQLTTQLQLELNAEAKLLPSGHVLLTFQRGDLPKIGEALEPAAALDVALVLISASLQSSILEPDARRTFMVELAAALD